MRLFISIIADFVICLVTGFAVMVLWGWFVAPTFHLPLINLAVAIGITVMMWLLTNHSVNEEGNEDVAPEEAIYSALFKPIFALIIGSVVHFFV